MDLKSVFEAEQSVGRVVWRLLDAMKEDVWMMKLTKRTQNVTIKKTLEELNGSRWITMAFNKKDQFPPLA